jgi:N-acetylneuraminate epimerase
VLGERPGIACVGSALARNGDDVYLMGGETKPGLRSAQAFRLWVADGALRSEQLPDLPADPGGDLTGETSSVTSGDASAAAPEGLAGAMAIFSGDSLVLAGGTSFPGARERYLQGQLYAHEHLKKHWRREILVFENSEWRLVGRLPHGLAHAQMFTWHDEVVIVGGERDGGEACTDVLTLVWGC